MILKEKEFANPSDPRLKAGEEAEKQMAFYLQRAFRKRDDCFVINDLRVVHDGDFAQIDHLVISTYGLFIVESKSVHGTISINQHGDWQRTYNDEVTGMPSPVLQAQEQGRILKELLRKNAEQVLGKILFGKIQKGFRNCPVCIYIAISDSGVIERGMDVPELFKADVVAGAITNKLLQLKGKANLLSPKNFLSTDDIWEMTKQEAQAAAEFLVTKHTLSASPVKVAIPTHEVIEASVTKSIGEGTSCPKCGTGKLVRQPGKNGKSDFFGCSNYRNKSMKCGFMKPIV